MICIIAWFAYRKIYMCASVWNSLWIIFMKARWNPRQLLDPMSPPLFPTYGNSMIQWVKCWSLSPPLSSVRLFHSEKKEWTQFKRFIIHNPIPGLRTGPACNNLWFVCWEASKPGDPKYTAKGTTCFPTTITIINLSTGHEIKKIIIKRYLN